MKKTKKRPKSKEILENIIKSMYLGSSNDFLRVFSKVFYVNLFMLIFTFCMVGILNKLFESYFEATVLCAIAAFFFYMAEKKASNEPKGYYQFALLFNVVGWALYSLDIVGFWLVSLSIDLYIIGFVVSCVINLSLAMIEIKNQKNGRKKKVNKS